jgi:CheY-like chemotaxis protein/nitrogen-specific signal transduction histidine kinase
MSESHSLLELEQRLKETETLLHQAQIDKENAIQNSTQFLAHLSHEIRTPLNIILGFTDLLTAELQSSQQRERLEAISSNSRHLLNLINKVLQFAKLDNHTNILDITPLDLQYLLAEIESMFYESLAEQNISLHIIRDPNLFRYVLTDGDRLKEVLINLVGNAAKFTKAGTIEIKLTQTSAREITFSVQDTGCGISAEELPTIFAPFIQASNQIKEGQGTGLGLAIAKKNVQLLGGNLEVISKEKEGTTFFFTLTCEEAANPQALQEDAIAPTSKIMAHETAQILVVDDHQANRELLYQMLAPYPFQLQEASNGAEALEMIKKSAPDLVLLDLAMPILDGESTIRQLRAEESTRKLPVLVLSAMAFEENRTSALKAGANSFLPKPFKKEHLLKELFRMLNRTYAPPAVETVSQNAGKETFHEISFPSTAWLKSLEETLQELDPISIETKLQEVEQSHPAFFNKASGWIKNFAFSELEAWLQSQLSVSSKGNAREN